MKRSVFGAAVAAVAVPVVVLALGRFSARGAEGALPDGMIRVDVRDVLRENDTIVTQVVVLVRPGSTVRVTGDRPNSGGSSTRAADGPPGGPPQKVTITLLGDRLTGSGADLFKVLVRCEAGTGTTTRSEEGTTPPGVRAFKDTLLVAVKPGEYREGQATPLYAFNGRNFHLKVDPPGTPVMP